MPMSVEVFSVAVHPFHAGLGHGGAALENQKAIVGSGEGGMPNAEVNNNSFGDRAGIAGKRQGAEVESLRVEGGLLGEEKFSVGVAATGRSGDEEAIELAVGRARFRWTAIRAWGRTR